MKRIQSQKFNQFVLGLAATTALIAASNAAYALPTGGSVSAGAATIDTSIANQVNIAQSSQKAVINWATFNTAAGESVNVAGPNSHSLTVHRIGDLNPVQFNGALNANNQQWIIAPGGMVFGGTASVNVGSLLVSTANITDANVMNPTIGALGNELYAFAQASDPLSKIVVNPGATIIASAAGGQMLQYDLHPTVDTSILNGLTEDTTQSVKYKPTGTGNAPVDFVDFTNFTFGFWYNVNPIPGTPAPHIGQNQVGFDIGTAGSEGKTSWGFESTNFTLNAGQGSFDAYAAGNWRFPPGANTSDSVTVSLVDAVTGDIISSQSWLNMPTDTAFTNKPLTWNFDGTREVKVVVTSTLDRPGVVGMANVGANVILDRAYAHQSSYVQFMAPTIEVRGAEIQADRISMVSGRAFEVASANYGNGQGEYVYAATPTLATNYTNGGNRNILVERSILNAGRNGLIEFDTLVTQGAFDTFNDTNGNGVNDDFPNGIWVDYPPAAGYEGMEVLNDLNKARGLYAGTFRSRYTIVPGDAFNPTPQINANLVNRRDEGLDRFFISEANVAKAQTENLFSYERANIADRGLALREGVMNLAGSGITINGGSPANLAPAAGGNPADLAPSAGGGTATPGASSSVNCAMMALGNEGLDPEGQRNNCRIDNEANNG